MSLDGRPAYRPQQKGTQTRFDRWIQSARHGLEGVLSVVRNTSKWDDFQGEGRPPSPSFPPALTGSCNSVS
jgi:hypothetical protein